MFSLNGFEIHVNCCVITIVLNPKCLACIPRDTNSLTLFLTACVDVQSSKIIRLLVPLKLLTTYFMKFSTEFWSHGIG